MENTGKWKSNEAPQLHLNFSNNEDFESLKEEKIKEINSKYPHAKLDPSLITRSENGQWLFKNEDLDKKAEIMHIAYAPDEKEDWTNI